MNDYLRELNRPAALLGFARRIVYAFVQSGFKSNGRNRNARLLCRSLALAALIWIQPAHGASDPSLAAMAREVNSLYQSGDYEAAVALAKQALEKSEALLGPDHPSVASAANNLAACYYQTSHPADAIPFYLRAIAIDERSGRPESLAITRNNLGALLIRLKRHAEAETQLTLALSALEQRYGDSSVHLLPVLLTSESLYGVSNRADERAKALARALAIADKHPDIAPEVFVDVLTRAGSDKRSGGDLLESKRLLERALDIQDRSFGPDHHAALPILAALAVTYANLEDLPRTESTVLRALSFMPLGDSELGHRSSVLTIAVELFALLGRPDESLRYARENWHLVSTDNAFGTMPRTLAATSYALALENTGHHRDAEDMARQSLRLAQQTAPENVEAILLASLALSEAQASQGLHYDAIQTLGEALKVTVKHADTRNDRLAHPILRIAEFLRQLDQPALALIFAQRALQISSTATQHTPLLHAVALLDVADALRDTSQFEKAVQHYARAISLFEGSPAAAQSPRFQDAIAGLAAAYDDLDKFPQAERAYLRLISILDVDESRYRVQLTTTLDNLTALLRRAGRDSDAAVFHARAEALRASSERKPTSAVADQPNPGAT